MKEVQLHDTSFKMPDHSAVLLQSFSVLCYKPDHWNDLIKNNPQKKGEGGVQGAGGGTIFNQVISMIWFIPVPSAQRYVTSWKGRG